MGKKTGVSCCSSTRSASSNNENKAKEAPQHLCEDDIRCPICLYLLVEPVRMPCRHCLCKACFTSTIKQTTLQCPVCRTRIGTFSRRAMKTGTLVDTKLWATIKKQFKEQLHLQELEMAQFAKAKCSAQVPSMTSQCPLVSSPAGPGEIGREFQEQILQLQQAHQQAGSSRQQESEDRRFALALQNTLNTPATRTRKRTSAAVAEESDAEEDSDSCSNSDRSRSSSRKLFGDLTNAPSSANDKSGCTSKTKKMPYASKSKENVRHTKASRKNSSLKSQQFPGCSKRPRLAGTAALNITHETETSDEDISFKLEDPAAELDNEGVDPTGKATKRPSCSGTPGTGDNLGPPLKVSKGSNASASTDNCPKNQYTSCKINKYDKPKPASYKICVNTLISGSTLKGVGKSNKSSVVTKSKRNNCNKSFNKISLPKSNKNMQGCNVIPAAKHVAAPLNNVIDISGQNSKSSISPNTVMISEFTRKRHSGSSTFSEGSSGYSSMLSTTSTSPASEQTSSVSPTTRSSGIRVRCLKELQNVAKVLQQDSAIGDMSDPDLAAAFLHEQNAAAAQLRQEAEDHKLAVQVQKNLLKLEVDRSYGSGEEYRLRSRRSTFRNGGVQTARTCKSVRESSPSY